jgi:hypothetical protein
MQAKAMSLSRFAGVGDEDGTADPGGAASTDAKGRYP